MLDITGCAHLFGGEAALRAIWCGGLAPGLQARVAVADTVGCAWAVARFGEHPAIVPVATKQRGTLAPLPSPPCASPPKRIDGARAGRPEAHRRRARPPARAARGALRRGVRAPPRSGARPRGRADHAAPAHSRRDRRAALRRADRARARRARHHREARRKARRLCWSGAAKARGCCRPRCSAPTAKCFASRSAPASRCAMQRASAACSPTGSA